MGGYQDAGGTVRGLVLDGDTFTTFDAPDAVSQTGAFDINDRRQIAVRLASRHAKIRREGYRRPQTASDLQ